MIVVYLYLLSSIVFKVRTEIAKCYELINRLGKGVVYLGSSRMGPDHAHYKQAFELSREVNPFPIFYV